MALTKLKLPVPFLLLTAFLIIAPFAGASHAQKRSRDIPCHCTQPQLVQRFWNTVNSEIYSKRNSALDDQARAEMQKIIDKGAQKMVDQKAFDRLDEADKHLRKLCKRAVKYAGKNKKNSYKRFTMSFAAFAQIKSRVTGTNIQQAKVDLCPLFPFC